MLRLGRFVFWKHPIHGWKTCEVVGKTTLRDDVQLKLEYLDRGLINTLSASCRNCYFKKP